MRKETVSTFGLVDLKALNKVLKASDTLYWGRDPEAGYILCNGHWAMRVFIPENSDAFATLCALFKGVPETCKRFTAMNGDVNDAPEMTARIKNLLNVDDVAAVRDTGLSQRIVDGKVVNLYRASDGSTAEYVAILDKHAAMISSCEYARQGKISGKVPVLFERGEERALLCPVNISPNEYLK